MEKGEIWIVEFPIKQGREQSGKRPSIVIADTKTSIVLIIPLTSNLESLEKLPHTLEIKKSGKNNLEKDSVALTFQLQALDKRRFVSKIGDLENYYMQEINRILRDLLKI